jgi:ubiquitin conjugation factor E4 B
LDSLASEIKEEQVQLKLNNQFLDRIIVARLLMDPTELANDIPQDIVTTLHVLHFDYLLNCWNTANDIRKNTVLRSKVRRMHVYVWMR